MEGTIVRRVIPSDNSCLFNAIGYVMEHDKKKALELRQWVCQGTGIAMKLLGKLSFTEVKLCGKMLGKHFPFNIESHGTEVIAATVASDPTKYNEAFLGKPNGDYCNWILDSEKWGGLADILS